MLNVHVYHELVLYLIISFRNDSHFQVVCKFKLNLKHILEVQGGSAECCQGQQFLLLRLWISQYYLAQCNCKKTHLSIFYVFYGWLVNFRPHFDLVQLPMSASSPRPGQLGLGRRQNAVHEPQILDVGEKVRATALGRWHSLAVTVTSMVWAFGWGRFGVLGQGDFTAPGMQGDVWLGDEPTRLIGKGDVKDWYILRIKDETTWKWVLSCTTPLCCRKLFELH